LHKLFSGHTNLNYRMNIIFVSALLVSLFMLGFIFAPVLQSQQIEIETSSVEEIFAGDEEGRLTIRYFNLQFTEEEKEDLRQRHDTPIKSGDAILLTLPNGEHFLIDAGMPHLGEQLDGYLNDVGVDELEYTAASHPHWDHIGGFLTLFQTREIGEHFKVNTHNDTSTYEDYKTMLESEDISSRYLEAGDELNLGDVEFEILYPPEGTDKESIPPADEISTRKLNNLSLVMKVSYGDIEYLFTGDIYRGAERDMIDMYGEEKLEADIVHAPHHGEDTSSTIEFIEAVNPDLTVISRDELASISVVNRYESFNSEVFATGVNGHIKVEITEDEINTYIEEEQDIAF